MLSHSPPLAALYCWRSDCGSCSEALQQVFEVKTRTFSRELSAPLRSDCSLASSPLHRRSDLPQSLIVPSYFCVNRHKRVASRCAFQFTLFPPDIHFVLLWVTTSLRSHSTLYISDLNHHIWTALRNIAPRPTTGNHYMFILPCIKRSSRIIYLNFKNH